MRTRRRKARFILTAAILILALLEGIAFFTCLFLQNKGVIYRAQLNKRYSAYVAERNETLGWPSLTRFSQNGQTDPIGSRVTPAFPEAARQKPWVSLYGDSFTWGSEVDDAQAWGNVLSAMLHARVANNGVGGYGSDQAFLRFHHNTGDEAKVVFLNHVSENILRNVNQYRHLLYQCEGLGFKPRFIIGSSGELELIPLPHFSDEEYSELVLDPGRHLRHEYFLPNGPSGIQKLSFPYTWTALKCYRNFHIKAKLRGVPWYAEFYDADHPSHGLPVTIGILKRFHEEALARGKTPVVTVIPTGLDLVFLRKHGRWPYQPLIDGAKDQGIAVFNFGDGIMSRLGANDIRVLFNDISSHYNENGNRILAATAFDYLQARKLLSPQGK